MNTNQPGEVIACPRTREQLLNLFVNVGTPEPPVIQNCGYLFLARVSGPDFAAQPACLLLSGHRRAASTYQIDDLGLDVVMDLPLIAHK